MTFITREQFDELYFKFKDMQLINLEDVFAAIEHDFHINDDKKNDISDEAAKAIFYDEKVLSQLEDSRTEDEDITSFDAYLQLKNEVLNGKKQV